MFYTDSTLITVPAAINEQSLGFLLGAIRITDLERSALACRGAAREGRSESFQIYYAFCTSCHYYESCGVGFRVCVGENIESGFLVPVQNAK